MLASALTATGAASGGGMAGMPGMGSGGGAGSVVAPAPAPGGALSDSHSGVMHMATLSWHTVIAGWQSGPFAWFVTAGVIGSALWYVRAMRRVRAKGRHWSVQRLIAFILGLVSVELALVSAVATLSMASFSAHVIQHLLLMMVGPPLLALGAPSTLILQTSPPKVKQTWLHVLHSRPFTAINHPVVVWFMYYGAMFAFFLSSAIGYAMAHPAVMDIWNSAFFFGATCFWWPMIGLDPIPRWRMGYGMRFVNLLIGVPFESFLGIALLSLTKPVAPMYDISTTHLGGGVLWGVTEILTAVAMVPIFIQWSRSDLREGKRMDARLDAEAAAAAAGVSLRPQPAGPDPARQRGLAATFAAIRRDA